MKDTFVVILCRIVGAASLIGAAMQMDGIRTAREEMGLVATTARKTRAVAGVCDRGDGGVSRPVVNILWIRADNLKQEASF